MRLINLDKLLDDIHRTVKESGLVNHECEIMDCIEYADIIDTDIEAEPVRHGRWEECFEDWRHQIAGNKCSLCGFEYFGSNMKYCPNCGAKMDLNN